MSRDAPAHPAKATGTSWRSVVADYQLEQHHVRLLSLAAEARDRAQEAREEIACRWGLLHRDQGSQQAARGAAHRTDQ